MTTAESLVTAFRADEITDAQYVERLRGLVSARDQQIHALVPESDRWERIQSELESLPSAQQQCQYDGTPVGIKDIFHVSGLPTQAGAELPADVLSGAESEAVRRLRAAGAIVLGKTVTAEFAYFDPGPTRNPHDPKRTPGGSSSGSAAAVAASIAPFALGTQTAGSIIRPAAFCGTYGFKPSYDRIPTDGVLPFAPSLDHVGYFTRNLDTAAGVANLLYDDWERSKSDRRPTLGVPAENYLAQTSDVGATAFHNQRERLRTAGFDVRPVPHLLADVHRINALHQRLMRGEGARTHEEWYRTYPDRYSDILARLIETGQDITDQELDRARRARLDVREQITAVMDEAAVDLLITPAAPGIAPQGLDDTGDPVMNVPWTFTGLPALSIPAAVSDAGLPFGLQCIARFGDDENLIAWGEQLADQFDANAITARCDSIDWSS